MKQKWHEIPGFPGYYASRKGEILGKHGEPLKQRRLRDGYTNVCLYTPNRKGNQKTHALIARTFIGPRPEGHQINHKNGNKADNRVQNLEYVTQSDHLQAEFRKNPYRRNVKLTFKDAQEIRHLLKKGVDKRQLAKQYAISERNLQAIKNNQIWKPRR